MIFDFYTLILIISTKIMGMILLPIQRNFSGETVERAIERAIVSKLNIVVEGTFRNAATPLQTLKKTQRCRLPNRSHDKKQPQRH